MIIVMLVFYLVKIVSCLVGLFVDARVGGRVIGFSVRMGLLFSTVVGMRAGSGVMGICFSSITLFYLVLIFGILTS
jgi:hypothetical protein